jgi:WD40 repeat protein
VARLIRADDSSGFTRTDAGQLVGTLPYMSPEQFSGDHHVDSRCDIYALGVNMFELLTGRVPLDLSGRSLLDAARMVREAPPCARMLRDPFGADIEAIAAKALSRDKEDRYASAAELAADLRRYLTGEPIAARHATALSLLRTKVARYRGVIVASGACIAALAAFSAFALHQAAENRRLASAERGARHEADANAHKFAQQLAISNIERGRLLGRAGNLKAAEELLWREHLQHLDSPLSFWALWELYSHEPCRMSVVAHTAHIPCMAFRADGRMLATASLDRTVKLWDVSPDGVLDERSSLALKTGSVQEISFDPDGSLLAIADESEIRLWDIERRQERPPIAAPEGVVRSISFDPAAPLLAFGGSDGLVHLWDVDSRACVASLPGETVVLRTRFSPDGRFLAASVDDWTVRLWDMSGATTHNPLHDPVDTLDSTASNPSGQPRVTLRGHEGTIGSVAFTSDSRIIATAAADRLIKLWDTQSGACLATLSAPNGNARGLWFGPDDRTLVSVGWWSIDTWDMESYRRRRSFSVPDNPNVAIGSPDGRFTVVAFPSGALRVWDMTESGALRLPGQFGRTSAALRPDGRMIATGNERGDVRLWDSSNGRCIATLPGHTAMVWTLRFCRTRPWLLTSSLDGTLRIWNLESNACIATVPGQSSASASSFDLNPSEDVVAMNALSAVELRDATSGAMIRTLPLDGEGPVSVRFSPDGRTLTTVGRANRVRLWNASDGAPIGSCDCTGGQPWTVAFNNDGTYFASGNWDKSIYVWRTSDRTLMMRLEGHNGLVRDVAFHPVNSRLLASAGADGTVRLWDIQSAQCLLTLDAFDGWDADSVCFGDDGDRLLAASANGDVVVWDLHYYDGFIWENVSYQLRRQSQE